MSARSFSFFMALRYLQPRRSFLWIITIVTVLGVVLGVAALIVVVSVMAGFEQELKNKIIGFDPHVTVTRETEVLDEWRELVPRLGQVPGVVAVAPFVAGPVVVEFRNRRSVPQIRGVDPESLGRTLDLATIMGNKHAQGRFDLEGDTTVIGSGLARILGARVGDELTVYSPGNISELTRHLDELEKGADRQQIADVRQLVLPREVKVTGIFSSGRGDYDNLIMFVPLNFGQELYGLGDSVHGLTIRTADPYHADVVADAVRRVLPAGLGASTWMELNEAQFTAIRVERVTLFAIMLIIVVVAAFCVMNTLITFTVMKTREIGIMKAIGAHAGQIVRVFLAQGMVVGAFGVLIGTGSGLGLLAVRNEFKDWLARVLHIELFPQSVYLFDKIPAVTLPRDVAIISVSAFVICSLAALIPAYVAARLDAAKALRFG